MILTMMPWCAKGEGTIPEPGKDYGLAINQAFERLREDDWGFIIEGDIYILTRYWFRSLERAIERFPEAGFFTVMRAPTACEWAVPIELIQGRERFDEAYWDKLGIRMDRRNFKFDIRFYRDIGAKVEANNAGKIADISDPSKLKGGTPNGGIFLMSKRVWSQLGGFKHGFKDEQIDFDMHRRVCAAGLRAYLIEDVFFFHAKDLDGMTPQKK